MPLELIQPAMGTMFLAAWVMIGGLIIRVNRVQPIAVRERQCW